MKPFNLEAARAGQPVCDIEGNPVRIACFDAYNGRYHVVGCGHTRGSWVSGRDLRMANVRHGAVSSDCADAVKIEWNE